MGSTFSSEMGDRSTQRLDYQVPMSNHIFNDDVPIDELPCMNCLRVEMGERACYTGVCDMCGETPPSLRWMYPSGPTRAELRSQAGARARPPRLAEIRSVSTDRPTFPRGNTPRRRRSMDSIVPTGMSTTRIDLASFTHTYRKIVGIDSSGEEKDYSNCVICLNEFKEGEKVRRLGCLHLYHVHCVDSWLSVNSCCPVCRVDIEAAAAQFR